MKQLVVTTLLMALLASCNIFSPADKPALKITTDRKLAAPVVLKNMDGKMVKQLKPTTKKPVVFSPEINQRAIYLVDIPGRSFKAPISLGADEVIELRITDKYATGYEVRGSKESENLFILNRALNKTDVNMRHHMKKIYNSTDKRDFAEIRKRALEAMNENRDSLQKIGLSLIRQDYGALSNTLILQQVFGEDKLFPVASFVNLYDSVLKSLQNQYPENDIASDFIAKKSPLIKQIKLRKDKGMATSAGKTAPEIRLPDKEQEMVSFHHLSAKQKLLLFWNLENEGAGKMLKELEEITSDARQNTILYAVSLNPNLEIWKKMVSKKPGVFHVAEPDGLEASSAKIFGVNHTPLIILTNSRHDILVRTSSVQEIKDYISKQ